MFPRPTSPPAMSLNFSTHKLIRDHWSACILLTAITELIMSDLSVPSNSITVFLDAEGNSVDGRVAKIGSLFV